MRTFEEIWRDATKAMSKEESASLVRLSDELQQLGTSEATIKSLQIRGRAMDIKRNADKALEHFNQALALAQENQRPQDEPLSFLGIGNVYRRIDNYPLAIEYYRRALSRYEDAGDTDMVANVYNNIAGVYVGTGDLPMALENCERALEHQTARGDSMGVARVTGNIGVVYSYLEDYATALGYLKRAEEMYREINHRAGLARVYSSMGDALMGLDRLTEALAYYESSIELQQELDNHAGINELRGKVIAILMILGRVDEAEEFLDQQSTDQFVAPSIRAVNCENRAKLSEVRGDLDKAQGLLTEALDISVRSGNKSDRARYHEMLRDLAQKRNDFAGYIEHNNEYTRINDEFRGKEVAQKFALMEAERKMEAERREHEKHRSLLYGALPKSVADRMIRGEDVSGDHFDNAAVMFIDIVDFTSHTSQMPPSNVVKLLENIFSTIDGICDEHSVVKVKTIGDSYMCFRGDADARSNARSIMHVALEVMKGAFIWPNGKPLQFRVGIHIGPATAGVIGTQRLQYDVWGDTVNVASRMESTSEPGRIHISQAFATLLPATSAGDSFEQPLQVLERGTIEIKGKGLMQTFWLE